MSALAESNNGREWWWRAQRDVHGPLSAMVSYLEETNRGLREDARFAIDLCSNFNPAGNGMDSRGAQRQAGGKMRCNLVQSAVDTGSSLILQQRTVPMAVTNDGDYDLHRRTERWTRAIQGQYYSLNVFDLAADIGVDALQTGTGFAIGYVDRDIGDKPIPVLERVLPNEILVDSVDGQYRTPRSIYRQKLISREVLKALYPKIAAQINVAGGPSPRNYIDMFIRQDNRADFVRVFEAWHLPSKPGAGDGKHAICTDNCDLRVEAYTPDVFPLVAYRYAQRRVGYFGQGLVERVTPAQIRLSELQQSKRDMQRLCSNPYMMVEENSGVSFDDMSNMPGQMVKYQRTMPQLVVFEGTPGDLSNEESQIKAEVWEQEGFSSSLQQGEVNKSLSSGRAVRAADSVASRRHVMPIRLFEQLYMDFAVLIASLNDQCAAIDPSYTVCGRYRSGKKTWIKEDLWTDIALPKKGVHVNVFPISALPTTPEGMWSALEELTQAGMIGKSAALDLMQLPDIASWDTLENANYDLTRWQIDRMLDGFQELPIPQQIVQNPSESAQLVTQAMLVAYRMQAPMGVMQLFEDYLVHLKSLAEKPEPVISTAPAALDQNAAAAAQLAMAGGAPPVLPGPPGAPMGMAA
jgi:hypothetical protein